MPKLQSSMRASLGLTVLVMGLLGMMLAVATGEAYQRLALDNQRESFVSLAKLKIQEITENLAQDSVELGLNAQATPGFHQAVINKDSTHLSLQLDEHFHRAFVTLGRVKLIKMYAYDKEFRLISSSKKGDRTLPDNKPVCTGLLSKIASRSKTARLKPDSELCRTGMRPVLATIVPVGGLQIKGYLQLIIDPTPNFAKADSGLGTPLKLTGLDKAIHYQSANWPKKLNKNILLAEYSLFTPKNQQLFNLTFASNIAELRKQLSTTRNFIFSIAAIIMLGTTLIALLMLQRTALSPLNTLTNHLRRVQKDKSLLGTKVVVSGNSEIVELATDFNNMSGELSTLYRTLENMAFTDALTGMPNRVLFYDRLEQITMSASRYKTQFALMMMDLNRFKNINDTLGHHIGDRLLKTVGERLQTILRESDTVARLGGDEFAALLPAIDHDEGVTIVAEKIVNALNKPIAVEGHNLSIGISIGLVRCPRDGDKTTLLMQHADVAMYHAKRKGLGYVFYDKNMNKENLFELTMESELRQAIENKDFELYYQPKIDLQHGHITGAEALIRWAHDKYGFISPEKFIPLAEQTGLIQTLTEWILEQALTQCAAWHANNITIGVSVNLSAYSLNDIDLIDTVHHALIKTEIEPQWLTLELTETAIMSDADRALSTLSQLNTMGVRLSVDDFGTGYSSLAYLKRFPVDEIKIDKSFVIDMLTDASDAVIVRSTIDLAHNMGMKVVAEGIESQEAWDKLAELGCNLGQGYHMCRPCPAADFKTWVYKSSWGLGHIKAAG
ncbi:diguanylate cyclase/phosphodiesterase (GGDEF & EAL domains) with PAS/PAC sensor(s) [hydrothermal vent metagenome]|uniref:Diguanylate cyclase/phosphodiesterase (GGDEF & EAL domains) with PAS/PAC sensor(S) n=1 Tax=hydrothermal vent metagenome TaxID=652676 RepID=A0A3B1AJE9_9ZZZZ